MSHRYTIHTTGEPGRKAHLRTLLKLAGFESPRIDEAAAEAATPKPKPDNLPTSPLAKAVARLFHRDETKPWADAEIAAFRAAGRAGMDLASVTEVAAFYDRERKKAEHFCRTTILVFLRHFNGELDKARADKPKVGKALEWTPANVVPMTDPAEAERIRVAALDEARRFKEGR
jgi:hypothetical protein